jgi:hypothetical protein
MAIYEIEHPGLPASPEWRAAADTGRWASEVRPHTTNREGNRSVCARVGGSDSLRCATTHVLLEMMDVAPDKEALLEALYEKERLPALARVPGIENIVRFRASDPGHPRHLTLYEAAGRDVATSDSFRAADRAGRWQSDVVPHTRNRHLVVYERLVGP